MVLLIKKTLTENVIVSVNVLIFYGIRKYSTLAYRYDEI